MLERGLQLSPEKTCITHIEQGFDFLGQNLRKYGGRLLITPSKKNMHAFLEKVRGHIRSNRATKQEYLIRLLKGRRIRTVAVPIWVKNGIDAWTSAAGVKDGRLLRPILKGGKVRKVKGESLSDWAVWSVVEQSAKQIGIERFGAHDLRRTCAKLCRKNGGDLEQIKFLLGHASIQTTERYLGSEQELTIAVNDNLGL
jgi:integrase